MVRGGGGMGGKGELSGAGTRGGEGMVVKGN